jgi:hypothetical protein
MALSPAHCPWDEYYSVTGVQYILEKGVPVFPTGGYYLRAWPLQYRQGRVRPPEARAANMLLFGRSRGLANLPNDVSTCRTGAVIDHGAREDRRATTAISVEKVMDAVMVQLDALAVSAR